MTTRHKQPQTSKGGRRTASSLSPRVSYYKKPPYLTTIEWQRELRRAYIEEGKQAFVIKIIAGEHPVFTDYTVENPLSKSAYKVALRSRENPGPNFCTCLDFKTNGLGTCKHIEAVLYRVAHNKKLAGFLKDEYRPAYTSLYLKYGPAREVTLRIGREHREKFEKLARKHFDRSYRLLPTAFHRIDQFLAEAAKISPDFRCYEDAMEFIIAAREAEVRQAAGERIARDKGYLDRLLKATLYPYQKEGILFAVRAGRCLIADEMGLGKTPQAIGIAELLKKEFGIGSVLIVCPTSLKYQWKSEIEKFTGNGAKVIEGNMLQRKKQYDADDFYKVVSYHVVGADLEAINGTEPDMVILDEAQRIKNWSTQTARQVKKIESKYAVVLTGTPIENKLEELYSIVQFIDPFKMGPLHRFLETHQIRDEHGKVTGYKELNRIKEMLADVVIRRTKKEVMPQLPGRVDKHLFVPLTKEQDDLHAEFQDKVARLVNKWKRFGFLDEKDRLRLLKLLGCMRMVADSTYILDQETRFDTKIDELMSILDNLFSVNGDKAVVFSQWERMTRLVKAELEARKVGFAHLHGGVPSRDRKALLDDFHQDPDCRVFLSTDAGGVGLNLQCASVIINLDIPWNPAVLEQRIGRIHRHGQKRNVSVINLISRGSIEERLLEVLKFKSSLFAGALDGGEDEVFMGESKFKRFMATVEKVASAPVASLATVTDAEERGQREETKEATEVKSRASLLTTAQSSSPTADLFTAAGNFFTTLTRTFADQQKTKQVVSSLFATDASTGERYLKIPVANEEAVGKAVEALSSLLSMFKKP